MVLLRSLIEFVSGYPPLETAMVTLLALVFANVVLGVAAAVKQHNFNLAYLADFVAGDLLKILVVLAFGFGAQSNGYLASVFYASATAEAASIVAKINRNFKAVFGVNPNLPVPPISAEK